MTSQVITPKQIARFPVGRQPYWIMTSKDTKTVYVNCPSSDELIAFDVDSKKEKGRIQFPERFASHAHADGRRSDCTIENIPVT